MNKTTGINPWCWRGKGSKHPDDKIFTDMENLLTEIDEGLVRGTKFFFLFVLVFLKVWPLTHTDDLRH